MVEDRYINLSEFIKFLENQKDQGYISEEVMNQTIFQVGRYVGASEMLKKYPISEGQTQ